MCKYQHFFQLVADLVETLLLASFFQGFIDDECSIKELVHALFVGIKGMGFHEIHHSLKLVRVGIWL